MQKYKVVTRNLVMYHEQAAINNMEDMNPRKFSHKTKAELRTCEHLGNSSSSSGGSHVLHSNGRLNTHTLLGQQVDEQRAGAAVTLGVETSLAVLVLQHTVQVDIEEVGRVKGTALGLGVELGAEDRARLVDHAFVA